MSRLDEMRHRGTMLRLDPQMEALSRIRGWLEALWPAGSIAVNRFELLSTAIWEACSNIVEHGGAAGQAQPFEVWWMPLEGADGAGTAGEAPDSLFLIRDHGMPFSADNWTETDFSDPEVWKRRRGFGLDIIHRVMSRVAYHPGTPQGNITLMMFASGNIDASRRESRHV